MTRTVTLAATLLLVGFAGCGGSQRKDPSDQVRAAVKQLAADAHAHRWGDFCAASTNPDKCERNIATAQAMGIDASQLVPSDDVLDQMHVTVHGSSATVDATAGKDAHYVLRDGRWLWVWDGE